MKIFYPLVVAAFTFVFASGVSSSALLFDESDNSVKTIDSSTVDGVPSTMTLLSVVKKGRSATSYALYNHRATYAEAVQLCMIDGWRLVQVGSVIKQRDVEQYILHDPKVDAYIWLGARFIGDTWYLRDNSEMVYTNFYNGYNKDNTKSPSCLSVATFNAVVLPPLQLKWLDTDCSYRQQFACEK